MSNRQLISSGSQFEQKIGYSRAVVEGRWVFVSGTTGYDYSTMTISSSVIDQTDQPRLSARRIGRAPRCAAGLRSGARRCIRAPGCLVATEWSDERLGIVIARATRERSRDPGTQHETLPQRPPPPLRRDD